MTTPRLLGGRYEVGELLGSGGMATVHRGRDTVLGRPVAIKTLRADLGRDPALLARFRREAQAAASLNDPSIVAVYDTGEEQGVPFIVMELVEGRTVRDILAAEGRPPLARALEIVSAVCSALNYSHMAGIVHRDIKPGNVMLTRSGAVKVMDFGIARALTEGAATQTHTQLVVGTAQYLSPEQARGTAVDGRSDVYSTGCLLYELVTGEPPFTGDSAVSLAYQHVREEPVPPSEIDPTIPASIDAIVLTAMAKEPSRRYLTAGDMQADIERALAGLPVAAVAAPTVAFTADRTSVLPRTETPGQDTDEATDRKRWPMIIAVVAVLALLVGAGAYFLTRSKTVSVPAVVGQSLTAATTALSNDGLRLGAVTRKNSTQPIDTVLEQNPQQGTSVASGTAVALVVSAGTEQVAVPNVVGLTQAAAQTVLTSSGVNLKVGNVVQQNSSQPAGTVLRQVPAAGEKVPAGTAVELIVASGQASVPNVVGMTEAAAQQRLTSEHFSVVTQTAASTATPGTVISQSPAGGTTASPQSTVTITVAVAPSPTPTPPPSSSPPPSTSPTPTTATTTTTAG
jgi:eukaryotic-like serine/threonine-protein kinase